MNALQLPLQLRNNFLRAHTVPGILCLALHVLPRLQTSLRLHPYVRNVRHACTCQTKTRSLQLCSALPQELNLATRNTLTTPLPANDIQVLLRSCKLPLQQRHLPPGGAATTASLPRGTALAATLARIPLTCFH